MTNKLNRSLKIVTLASATVMLMISAAYAATFYSSKTSTTNGAEASCSLEIYSRTSGLQNGASITCDIIDTEADGSTPYVLWQIDGYAERRINGSGPKDTRVQRVDSAGVNDGIGTVRFKACRDENFSRDDCDYYETWNVN